MEVLTNDRARSGFTLISARLRVKALKAGVRVQENTALLAVIRCCNRFTDYFPVDARVRAALTHSSPLTTNKAIR
jgi:hypothetical protein